MLADEESGDHSGDLDARRSEPKCSGTLGVRRDTYEPFISDGLPEDLASGLRTGEAGAELELSEGVEWGLFSRSSLASKASIQKLEVDLLAALALDIESAAETVCATRRLGDNIFQLETHINDIGLLM